MTKSELRVLYKKKRLTLSDEAVQTLSQQIFETFKNQFDITGKSVSIFLPIEHFKEVNTWYFLESYEADYYLPVVRGDHLVHIKYDTKEQLKPSEWGILEPQYGSPVEPSLFDAVMIPLLAYDLDGNRIGYGKGFYDSFLQYCKPDCQFIGLSYYEPEQQRFDTIPSDIKLHYCVTPQKVHNFGTLNSI